MYIPVSQCIRGSVIPIEVGLCGDKTHGSYLDSLDFEVIFFCSYSQEKNIRIAKTNLVRKTKTQDGVTDIRYIAYVDTSLLGPGRLYMKMTLSIPDSDYDGGVRTEIDGCDCYVNIL